MITEKEQLEAEIAERDAQIELVERENAALKKLLERAHSRMDALKAQQPSAGVADERAAFEAWYSEHYYEGDESCTRQWLFREPCGNYRHEHASRDWRTWQARARLNPCRAKAVPDGYVMVPVNSTEAIRDAINLLCDDSSAFDDSEAFWRYLLAAAQPTKKESE